MFRNKKLIVVLLALVLVAGVCFAADPCEGYWISYDDKTGKATAGWYIYIENGTLFGKIARVIGHPQDVLASGTKGKGPYDDFPVPGDMSKMTTVGTPWIYNMKKKADGKWEKGKIVDPNDGSRYTCTITFHKAGEKKNNKENYKTDTLEMRGSIGPIGRSQYWVKATKEEVDALN